MKSTNTFEVNKVFIPYMLFSKPHPEIKEFVILNANNTFSILHEEETESKVQHSRSHQEFQSLHELCGYYRIKVTELISLN